MNIQRYGPRRWRLTWERGRDPVTGRRRRETQVVTGTRAEAERVWRARQAAWEAAQPVTDPARATVADLLTRWLAEGPPTRRAPTTRDYYGYMVRRYLLPTLGAIPVAALDARQIEAARQAWATWPRRARAGTVSTGSLAGALRTLRAACTWAVREGWIPTNPVRAVPVSTGALRSDQWWTVPQARAFLAATAGEWYAVAWQLALLGGLRLGEALGLRWQDIDWLGGHLWIRQVRRPTTAVGFGPPKTHRSRRPLPLDAGLRAVLTAQARRLSVRAALAGPDWPDPDLVVVTHVGTPATHRGVERAFAAAVVRVGLPAIRFHDLRHTHATLLRQAGADWRVIADRLGHAQVQTTAAYYLHADLHEQQRVADQLAATLGVGTRPGT
jgi:integrase